MTGQTPALLVVVGMPDACVDRLAAMLGMHPQMAALPELAWGVAERLGALDAVDALSADGLTDGLLRAVAHYFCGGQTDAGILRARDWLRRRASWSFDDLVDRFAQHLAPAVLAVPAACAGWRVTWLERVAVTPVQAGFVHVVQHPVTQCAARARALRHAGFVAPDYKDYGTLDWPRVDPQLAWYRINANIDAVLGGLPAHRAWRLHAEDLDAHPARQLDLLLRHFGLARNAVAIDAMLHPERGPFAGAGPHTACGGGDAAFLADPAFRGRLRPLVSLRDKPAWREDRDALAVEVVALARRLGYQ